MDSVIRSGQFFARSNELRDECGRLRTGSGTCRARCIKITSSLESLGAAKPVGWLSTGHEQVLAPGRIVKNEKM